ncbi:VF530 family protein [Halopseudomonas oceani]|uniref:VF530 family protein n=1 Tax=Halopseudomonas oceani TaxID=1708783 RepID=UPI002AA7842F|nr:VF530 family protein [Halopseudomonas oceani]
MSSTAPPDHSNADPLHGITLKVLLQWLVDRYGWDELGRRVPINCFLHEPSLNSSLKFLRRTPWARVKVEALYIASLPASRG